MTYPIAITGHRPQKLGGFQDCPLHHRIKSEIRRVFLAIADRHPEGCLLLSGMALGVDQWAAEIALDLGWPVYASIPCDNQEGIWPQRSQEYYRDLLSRCTHTVIVSPGPYTALKMQVRNQYMVDRCRRVVAVWDGTGGGTANCVTYARTKGRPITQIDPMRLELLSGSLNKS